MNKRKRLRFLETFANFIVRNRWWVLLAWVVCSAGIIMLSPSLSSVESSDQSQFLPSKYESVQAQDLAKKISPRSNEASDIIVFKSVTGKSLTDQEQGDANKIIDKLNHSHLNRVSVVAASQLQAPDRRVWLADVAYSGNPNDQELLTAVKKVRSQLHQETSGTSLVANVTGQVAIGADTEKSFNKALQIVSIGTLILVFLLPMLVFRSPFIGLLPVLSVGLVYSVGTGLVADAAKVFDFQINQQLSVLFTVVLFGVGTDYILFLLFRYREKLRTGDHTKKAVAFALSRAGTAILCAALVVISSFVAMFFAEFGIFSSFARGIVICVAVMLIAALTLIPALVSVIGPKLFWPSKGWKQPPEKRSAFANVGKLVSRRPGTVSLVVLAVLLLLSAGVLSYKSDFSSFAKAPSGTESAKAYDDIQGAFPAGALSPTQVLVSSDQSIYLNQLTPLTDKLQHAQGVANVVPPTITPDGKAAIYTVVLKDNPFSDTALTNVSGPIRDAAHSVAIDHTKVLVGGVSGALADVSDATFRDLRVVFPIAAVFIFLILGLLLRSLVAPIYLLISVSLCFAATLGGTVFAFTKVGHEPGLIFFLPIMLYLFVVAISTDYNILTITRLREEVREGNDPREAARLTIEHSSGTVISAGIILAGTFGSLLLAGIGLLTQMGASIAVGVLIASFVIAPLLIPSISALLGYTVWWPGRYSRKTKTK